MGFGQRALAKRHAVPLCLSVCNRCLSSAGTNGIQSVWLRNDRVTGLTHWPAIYLSMVSNGGVVRRVAGPTDQSGISPEEDREGETERRIKARERKNTVELWAVGHLDNLNLYVQQNIEAFEHK